MGADGEYMSEARGYGWYQGPESNRPVERLIGSGRQVDNGTGWRSDEVFDVWFGVSKKEERSCRVSREARPVLMAAAV